MASGVTASNLPELGFLPAGTGNAAVRAFRLGTDPHSVARSLATADAIPVDVGVARHQGGERAFLLWCGVGWDAVIIHALDSARTGFMGVSGLLGRSPQVLSAVARYAQPPINAQVGRSSFGVFSSVIIANVGEIAFRGLVAEAADPCDGQFDVVGVPRGSLLGSVRLGIRMLTSSLTSARGVRHALSGRVTLETDGEVPFQLDGEPVGMLPVTVTLTPGAVRFLLT